MPDYINNLSTSNGYTDALTFPPAIDTTRISFDVGNNPVACQLWRFIDEGRNFILDQQEIQFLASTFGVSFDNVAGMRFRSLNAGAPAVIYARRNLKADPQLTPGTIVPGTVSASGGFTPPPTGVNFNANGGFIANEPGLDLVNAAAAAITAPGVPGLTWAGVDTAGVKVAYTPTLTAGPVMIVNPPDKITADVTVAATTTPGTTVITSTSKTYLARLVRIRFFTPRVERTIVTNAVNTCRLVLQKDGVVIADPWGRETVDHISTGGLLGGAPACLEYFDTPTAAAHTYTVSAYASVASEFVVGAGAGGGSVAAPAVLSIEYVL